MKAGPLAEMMKETLAVANVKSVTHVQIDRVANLKKLEEGGNKAM